MAQNTRRIDEQLAGLDTIAWYWRLIALLSSWMILGGYLMLPAAFDSDPQLRFSTSVLAILVVTILTTGYCFTALLCFACRSWSFQAETVFLPALSSSIIGLLTLPWTFASSKRYEYNTFAKIHTALSVVSTMTYAGLLVWTHVKLSRSRKESATYRKLENSPEAAYYKNYLANMYPSAQKQPEQVPLTEDELVNRQMARLLTKQDPMPSPDAFASTFKITLPEDPSHEMMAQIPPSAVQYARVRASAATTRAERTAWERIGSLGRRGRHSRSTLLADLQNRGRESLRSDRSSRAVSREERRREIEMGTYPSRHIPSP